MNLIKGYNDSLAEYFFELISNSSRLKCQKGAVEAINDYVFDFNSLPINGIPGEGLPIEISRQWI